MPEQKELSELVDEFISEKRIRNEGDSGVEGLNKLAEALGYKPHGFRYGSALEVFLADNSGCVEAIQEWIGNQRVQEWSDNLESELPEEDDDLDDDKEALESLPELNEKEKLVLAEAVESSKGNSHDFGCSEDIDPKRLGITRKQFAGYMSQLSQKGYLRIDEPIQVNGQHWVTQFVLTPACKAALGIDAD